MSRAVHINNEEYLYRVGNHHVRVTKPDGKSIVIPITNILNLDGRSWTFDEVDQIRPKIVPSMIKKYLIEIYLK